jgi:hypothetical protein
MKESKGMKHPEPIDRKELKNRTYLKGGGL